MKRNLLNGSFFLFGLSVLLWLAMTAFESSLVGISFAIQRLLSLLLLVLPTGIGVILGILSLARKEGLAGLAITSIILNAIFALFFLMIILFAG